MHNKIQFFEKNHKIEGKGWGGAENDISLIAFNVPEGTEPGNIEYDHVLKEPKGSNVFRVLAQYYPPETQAERDAVDSLAEHFDSREHFERYSSDYGLMKETFGDLLPDTRFIIGEPRERNEHGFYIIQELIRGQTWTEFSKTKSPEEKKELFLRRRNQLINLIGGARKVLIETEGPVDIWGDNLMVDEEENFVLIDPGSPSELARNYKRFIRLPKGMRGKLAGIFYKRAVDLERYPSVIGMTEGEITEMNRRFGFTQDQYEKASYKLLSICDTMSNGDTSTTGSDRAP
jgi:hypothetical protein